jgi:hypothetical protein
MRLSLILVELSAIAAGTGGFVINGESEDDLSGGSVSSAGDNPLIEKDGQHNGQKKNNDLQNTTKETKD